MILPCIVWNTRVTICAKNLTVRQLSRQRAASCGRSEGVCSDALITSRWRQAKVRELLLDGLALAHPDLLLQDGAFRGPLLAHSLFNPPAMSF